MTKKKARTRKVKEILSPWGMIAKEAKPEALAIATSIFDKMTTEWRAKSKKGILLESQAMKMAKIAVRNANALYANFQKSIIIVEDFKSYNEVGYIGMSVNFGPKGNEGYTASECIKRRQNTVAFLRNLRINSPRMWKDLLDMINEAKK